MFTIPTRAKMVEAMVMSSAYGVKLMYDMSQAMLLAKDDGRHTIRFVFDHDSFKSEKNKQMNETFKEYLRIKKYKIVKETDNSFDVRVV